WRIGPRDLVALGRRARALLRGDAGRAPGPPQAAGRPDALADVITDLTAETGSLVEALDDLGDPGAYSPAGYARMRALAAELRRLRGHVGRPLPDLAQEVERALGLDIEVAARPGVDPAAARADLDAFIDVADAFTGENGPAQRASPTPTLLASPTPTLGAFLAYLTAAQQEEFGLETGRVGESDSVKLLTVHAAKGLQWPAVFVPGLACGERSQVFPARPRTSTRWTDNPRLIPFRLRGDAADLPALRGLDGASLGSFGDACAARDLAEERRLMYVAGTRAAFWLGCSGYWWGESGSGRLGPSLFLDELQSSGTAQVSVWAPEPAADAENPLLAAVPEAQWPAAPAGRRYEAVREAAALVDQAMSSGSGPGEAELTPAEQALVAAWQRDAGLLLAERAQRRAGSATQVALPARLSVSSLVSLARDPAELASQVRRPMPRPPAALARKGTAFHRWLEQRYGQQRLIDDSDLFEPDSEGPGGGPDGGLGGGPGGGPDGGLGELKDRFDRSEWADRWPHAVEVPFETVVGDRLVRGRIDAVFADAPEGGYDVVDWKTGRPPESETERHATSVQLAAYRLAWAALAGVPVAQVRAAFYHVAHDLTVRPADLLDEAGLAALIEGVPEQ
ncbi:MAG: PD-(D/E)XK nuclease family protein, partial [Streptosporangiaceae bacterium]|nr:PD-(D/E)XK nuclease family protein [Streptosporangiaceae bacterium]